MAFKLTFSKTAVDDFFNGAVGARFKVQRGRGMICPTNQSDDDVIEFVSRNRGGMELSFLGDSFSEAQVVLDGGEMVFFTLEETATDWLEMVPFTGIGAPEKFKPVARFWNLDRKSSYIPVAERDIGPEIRRPVGRPRKVVEEVAVEAVVKRGPGRPKKVVEETHASVLGVSAKKAVEVHAAPAEVSIKRGPGRPKKVAVEQQVAKKTPIIAAPTPEVATTPAMVRNESSTFSDIATAIRNAHSLTEQSSKAGRPSSELVAARNLLEVVREVAGQTLPQVVGEHQTAPPSHNNQPVMPQFAVMMFYPVGIAHPMAEDVKPVLDAISHTLGAAFSGQAAVAKPSKPAPVAAPPIAEDVAIAAPKVTKPVAVSAPKVVETPARAPETEMTDGETSVPELVYVPESDVDISTLEENAARAANLWKQGRRSSGNESTSMATFPKRTNTRTIVVEDRRRVRQTV